MLILWQTVINKWMCGKHWVGFFFFCLTQLFLTWEENSVFLQSSIFLSCDGFFFLQIATWRPVTTLKWVISSVFYFSLSSKLSPDWMMLKCSLNEDGQKKTLDPNLCVHRTADWTWSRWIPVTAVESRDQGMNTDWFKMVSVVHCEKSICLTRLT